MVPGPYHRRKLQVNARAHGGFAPSRSVGDRAVASRSGGSPHADSRRRRVPGSGRLSAILRAVEFIGESPSVRTLRERLKAVATTPLPVLLIGETGTGKEVAARVLHDQSGRTGAFVPVDCAAISPTLVESELFGHERGAFTGADRRRDGLIAAARGGTFFLDEVAELPLDVQTRLLRLLQEGTFRPVGGQAQQEADIRVVAATWKDLTQEVAEGRFRRDLYHRLGVVELRLPALRDRPEDVPILLDHFLQQECSRIGRRVPRLDPAVRAHLKRWPWPGNVRELRNVAHYVAALAQGARVGIEGLPPQLRGPVPDLPGLSGGEGDAPPLRTDLPYLEARRMWLDAFQLRYVEQLLAEHDGNISRAARAAEMDRRSIQRILQRLKDLATET
ncbi:MAG: sigma-54-dependent Fis family transcriptional regulator [Deltaproteobacteria bacterium]|nr:MAG: sigma-54-dependent Fis family transcriptional regulator [Deltaproteobacteria bacterium]